MLALAVYVLLCFAVSLSGAIARPGAWHRALKKPRWNPPNWLFAPVWSILYLMIAISGWLVWQKVGGTSAAILPMAAYGAQLVFNFLWSPLFFGAHRMRLALVDMGLMWLFIAASMVLFWPIDALAALLLVPYLLWVSFAFGLNTALIWLNPDQANTPRDWRGSPIARNA